MSEVDTAIDENIVDLESNIQYLLIGQLEEILDNKSLKYVKKMKSLQKLSSELRLKYDKFSYSLICDQEEKNKFSLLFRHYYGNALSLVWQSLGFNLIIKKKGLIPEVFTKKGCITESKTLLLDLRCGNIPRMFDFLKRVSGWDKEEKVNLRYSLPEYKLVLEQFQYFLEGGSVE